MYFTFFLVPLPLCCWASSTYHQAMKLNMACTDGPSCCLFFFSSALNYKAWMADHCYVRIASNVGVPHDTSTMLCNFLTCLESCRSVGEDVLSFPSFCIQICCCPLCSYLLPLGFFLVASGVITCCLCLFCCCLWGSYLFPMRPEMY